MVSPHASEVLTKFISFHRMNTNGDAESPAAQPPLRETWASSAWKPGNLFQWRMSVSLAERDRQGKAGHACMHAWSRAHAWVFEAAARRALSVGPVASTLCCPRHCQPASLSLSLAALTHSLTLRPLPSPSSAHLPAPHFPVMKVWLVLSTISPSQKVMMGDLA
jgi:hypothetical protein